MGCSVNNRLIVEQYVREGLKASIQGGIATPNQKDEIKGLRLLMPAELSNGKILPKGSMIYIKESILHENVWSTKLYKCDTLSEKFMIVDFNVIEFYDIPTDKPAA